MFSARLGILGKCLVALLASGAWEPASAQSPAPAAQQRAAPGSPGTDPEWRAFRNRYLAPTGRVIDTANNGISHSEGQGYGMFFAVHFDDRASFDRMWGWTQQNLSRRQDGLFAWRFDPRSSFPVSDTNNAVDGDIYIAWALSLASEKWGAPAYRAAATRMTEDILKCCVTEVGTRVVLLPGTAGFRSAEGTVVNPSYYAFTALRALSRLVADRRWSRLERDGLEIIGDASLGRWRLPPDWLLLPQSGGHSVAAPAWPARFSWDAIRVPLNLAWLQSDHVTLGSARQFWSYPGHRQRPPAWVDLRSGETPPYAGHAGIRAVQALVGAGGNERPNVAIRVEEAPDYYGAALVLQARIASAMPPAPPAAEPPEEARPAASNEGLVARGTAVGSAILAWVMPTQTSEAASPPPDPPAARWARPDFQATQQVRGVQPGLRGLSMPR